MALRLPHVVGSLLFFIITSQATQSFSLKDPQTAAAALSNDETPSGWNLTFDPPSVKDLYDGNEVWVQVNMTLPANAFQSSNFLIASVKDERIAKIKQINHTKISQKDYVFETPMLIRGTRLGKTYIEFRLQSPNGTTIQLLQKLHVIVLRKKTIHSIIFRVITTLLVVIITLMMGCDLDPKIIWSYIKRPLAPGIGFASQFIIMPLTGFAVAHILNIRKEFAFGLLTIGCSPGGGGSNMWTVLLHGELNLSITMTFISTISAMGMMPLWLFALGRFFIDVNKVVIPYYMIALNLLQVVVPCALGILIRWKFEKTALKLRKGIRPLALVFILYILSYGTYANLYMYELIGDYPIVIISGALLPWIGFALGGLLAIITRQTKERCITIALETGIQNIGIAIIILLYSIPQPLGDLAGVVVVVVAIFTPIPLYFILLVISIRRCVVGRRSHDLDHEASVKPPSEKGKQPEMKLKAVNSEKA